MVRVHEKIRAERRAIEQEISAAEVGSKGELVVVVCRKAGHYGRYESFFGFLFSLLILFITWTIFQRLEIREEWVLTSQLRLPFWSLVLILIAGYSIGVMLGRRFPGIVTLFVPRHILQLEAKSRAAEAFQRFRVMKTEESTGILIYVAEFERTVVVLADQAISDCVQQADWDVVRDAVLGGIRERDPVAGLIKGLKKAGDILRLHMPCESPTFNERPDRLHFT